MTDVTRILSDIEQGDTQASEQLLPLVYDELWKLAASKMAQLSAPYNPASHAGESAQVGGGGPPW